MCKEIIPHFYCTFSNYNARQLKEGLALHVESTCKYASLLLCNKYLFYGLTRIWASLTIDLLPTPNFPLEDGGEWLS